LLIGIENQLGLKYFAGVAEDHAGELFFGIQDRYREQRRFVTFGRGELTSRLTAAGFASVEYLYPFPDYKVPVLLLTHEALTTSRLEPAEMIGRTPARGGAWPRLSLFCEGAAWETVCRNGLAPDLANSFLAVAADRAVLQRWLPERWLAARYHTARRRDFQTVTSFSGFSEGTLVERRSLCDDATGASSDLVRLRTPSSAAYIEGASLNCSLVRALFNPATTPSDLCALLAPWVVFLQRAVTAGEICAGDALLPGSYLDCVPWNLLGAGADGDLAYVGAEWDYLPPLRLELPFVHGMINLAALTDGASNAEVLRTVPYGELLIALAERLGLTLSQRSLAAALEAEADWIGDVFPVGREDWLRRITSLMEVPLSSPRTLPHVLSQYEARVAELLSAEAGPGRSEYGDLLELLAGLPAAIGRADRIDEELET
jgi:hypothetical protein